MSEHPATASDETHLETGTHEREPAGTLEDHAAWPDEAEEEMPRRPRRRLLTPASGLLAVVLLTACGFIGGVLVEKGQTSTTSAPGAGSAAGGSGRGARLAALLGGPGAASTAGAAAGAASGSAGGSGAGATGGATVGQVAFVEGGTLYVTGAQGNTVRVRTSGGSTVTKTVTTTVKAIHPGETVVVSGSTAADGTVTAESIRVGDAGGGPGSLLGGGSTRAGTRSGAPGGAEPQLFGGGG